MNDLPDCARCYIPIGGRAIHDRGEPWHEHCRRAQIVETARANADRHIAQDVHYAQVLARIQRKAAA